MVSQSDPLARGAATGVLLCLVVLVVLLLNPAPVPAAGRAVVPQPVIIVATPVLALPTATPLVPTEVPAVMSVTEPTEVPPPTEALPPMPVQQDYSAPVAVELLPPTEVPLPTEVPPATPATFVRNVGRLVVVRDHLPERQERP